MQELEKILEEIDAHAMEFEAFGVSDEYISINWVKDIIRKHMNDGWIPVEDRLPEDTESGFYNAVSVTMSNGRVTHGCYRNADREWWVAREDGEFKYTRSDEVIAWRPLPEPYRPKKESEGSRRLREREEFFKG